MWGYSTSFPFRYANYCLPTQEQWQGYNVTTDRFYTKILAFSRIPDISDSPSANVTYSGYTTYINANDPNSSGTSISIFNFESDSYHYWRTNEAADLTPEESRVFNYDFAGKWVNSKGNSIYVGLPIFEFTCDGESWKMIPCVADDITETSHPQNEIDPTKTDLIRKTISNIMVGYDNSHVISKIYTYESRWNGSGYNTSWKNEWALDYQTKAENGGYWTKEDTSIPQDVEEDTTIPVLEWICLDEETQRGSVTNSGYLGSVLQANLFYKYCQYELQLRRFKNYVIKNQATGYFYQVEEEEEN